MSRGENKNDTDEEEENEQEEEKGLQDKITYENQKNQKLLTIKV